MVSWTRGDAQEAAAWTRACPGREPSCLRSLNQALGDSQRGRRSHQNSVAVVTIGQPESHSASPADDRLRRCWPPVEIPATPRPAGGQPRQKRSRPRVNVRDQDWIERPIKAHLLGGGSRNRESAAPLQQIGVPAAENRPQRVWLECVSDEVAANRESAGQALALHFNFTRPGAGGQYCVRRFEPSTRGLHDQGICARANGLSRGLLPGFPLSSPGRRSVTRPSGRAGR